VAFVKDLLWFLQLHLWLFVFLSSRGRCHASDPVMTALVVFTHSHMAFILSPL